MALRDPCMREIPVCEDSTIFLSLPSSFFFLSSLWKRTLRRKEPVRWKLTVTHPTASLNGRTYASSFWSRTTAWHRNSHSGKLVHTALYPYSVASVLYLVFVVKLHKFIHFQKSYFYRYLRYFWDPRRHPCVSTCKYSVRHGYPVLTTCGMCQRSSAGVQRWISWKTILRFSICYVWK